MQSRQLVHLAAWIASHGSTVVRSPGRLYETGVQQYWAAARCRHDRWGRAFKQLLPELEQQPDDLVSHQLRLVAEEVLTGEMLTRVWSAVLTVYDARRNTSEYQPIAASIMDGQQDARQRVLQLIAHSPHLDLETAVQLNRLRRRCERWTDLLLAHLLLHDDVRSFTIDPQRADDFAASFRERQTQNHTAVWSLLLGSLQAAFETFLLPGSPNPDLNERIAAGILASFPGECFDTFGLIPSLWLIRMTHCADDAQGMIENLLAIDSSVQSAPPPAFERRVEIKSARRFDGPSQPYPHGPE